MPLKWRQNYNEISKEETPTTPMIACDSSSIFCKGGYKFNNWNCQHKDTNQRCYFKSPELLYCYNVFYQVRKVDNSIPTSEREVGAIDASRPDEQDHETTMISLEDMADLSDFGASFVSDETSDILKHRVYFLQGQKKYAELMSPKEIKKEE